MKPRDPLLHVHHSRSFRLIALAAAGALHPPFGRRTHGTLLRGQSADS